MSNPKLTEDQNHIISRVLADFAQEFLMRCGTTEGERDEQLPKKLSTLRRSLVKECRAVSAETDEGLPSPFADSTR